MKRIHKTTHQNPFWREDPFLGIPECGWRLTKGWRLTGLVQTTHKRKQDTSKRGTAAFRWRGVHHPTSASVGRELLCTAHQEARKPSGSNLRSVMTPQSHVTFMKGRCKAQGDGAVCCFKSSGCLVCTQSLWIEFVAVKYPPLR